MKLIIDAMINELGNSFRGLWRSMEIKLDGTITAKWSVTFVYKNEYVESPYFSTTYHALEYAIGMKTNEN